MNWLVSAHPEGPLTPGNLWSAWNFQASILILLILSGLIYLTGTLNLWRHAGIGRGITPWRCASFLGAMMMLMVALISPLDALSEALFSAHMVQHLILILIAAPLLVRSDFSLALFWALPRSWAQKFGRSIGRSSTLQSAWRILSHPICAWILFTATLWIWHASSVYEAALKNETIHTLEHLGFLAASMLFWFVLFRYSEPHSLHRGVAIPYLFTTILQSGILGALMTFSERPWYSSYTADLAAPWALTPLGDQQLAGLIMWVPGGFLFSLLNIFYFASWLRALERRSSQHRAEFQTQQELK